MRVERRLAEVAPTNKAPIPIAISKETGGALPSWTVDVMARTDTHEYDTTGTGWTLPDALNSALLGMRQWKANALHEL